GGHGPYGGGFAVVADGEQRRRLDPGVAQQLRGALGVLTGDGVGLAQLLDGPRREVAEVADRRGDDHQRSSHADGRYPPSVLVTIDGDYRGQSSPERVGGPVVDRQVNGAGPGRDAGASRRTILPCTSCPVAPWSCSPCS